MKRLFFTILFLTSLNSIACDCELYSIQHQRGLEIEHSDLIFFGKLVSKDEDSGSFKLKVLRVFKGEQADYYVATEIISESDSLRISSSCAWWPPPEELGDEYLIYANFSAYRDDWIFISQCSLTRCISNPQIHFCYDDNSELDMFYNVEELSEEELFEIAQSDLNEEIKLLEKIKTH